MKLHLLRQNPAKIQGRKQACLMGVFDARILMRVDFDFEIKVFKHDINK